MANCGTLAGYFVHRRRGETTCQLCRDALRAHGRKYREPTPRTCEDCGLTWLAGPKARVCGKCRSARGNGVRRRRQPLIAFPGGSVTWLPSRHPVMRRIAGLAPSAPRLPVFVSGPCGWCRESFTTRSSTGLAAYCSTKCLRYAARARSGKRFVISPKMRRVIYVRDGWICQLCSDPVAPNLPTSDLWAATLDHIVPQSQGGTHDPENLRLAHRWCNSVRGDDTYYTAADLVAC